MPPPDCLGLRSWLRGEHRVEVPAGPREDRVDSIPGTRSIQRLEENAAALEVELTRADLERLERIFPKDAAAGTRYPEAGMAAVGR